MASRFYVPPEQIKNQRFTILGSEARHAALVLRKKPGDIISLFDGKDLSYQGRLDAVSPERVEGRIVSESKAITLSVELVLNQALIKGPKWDWLVEKSCEVGVAKLVPLLTARTIIKPSKAEVRERWKRISLAASKQCGRQDVMEVAAPVSLSDALQQVPKDDLILIPWEKEMKISVRQAMSSSPADAGGGSMDPRQRHSGMTPNIALFIGPEGGWEAEEVELAVRHGAVPVRLGATLLRSETAGLVASALVLSELGVYS